MKRRWIAIFSAFVLVLTALAGCANQGENSGAAQSDRQGASSNESAEEGSAQADFSEELSISAWIHTSDNNDGYFSSFNENPMNAWLMEKFNVTFDWQIPAIGSEADSLSLMIGSGDYTDVFDSMQGQQTPEELYEDGVIQDLTPYVEQYMPNYLAFIATDDEIRKSAYTSDGKILYIPNAADEAALMWGGLMYNRQILEDMTDQQLQFPSGNQDPTTVEDWDYMLALMKQYYSAAGFADYACLIIPYTGYFQSGDLETGFGVNGEFYVDADGKLQSSFLQEGFYDYLVKMKEWYSKGYVYADFASRNTDPEFFPNPALTWSGAAGVFYGLVEQLGTAMSMPEDGLNINMRPLASPVGNGNTPLPGNATISYNDSVASFSRGWVVSVNASEEKLIRWLQICDYLFSEEGSMIKSYGLTKEQAAENEIYKNLGLQEGAYWFDDAENFVFNPLLDPTSEEATIKEGQLRGLRLPGLQNNAYLNQAAKETRVEANEVWYSNGFEACVPAGATLTPEENAQNAPLSTAVNDYVASMLPKFIMGTEELTPDRFAEFGRQLETLGLTTMIELQQTAYDRYMSK